MEEALPPMPLVDLQPEIWLQIFHKLPLKFIVRCMLVCKQWRCLVSDPFFRSNYNPNSIRNHPISLFMFCWTRDGIICNDTFKCITDAATGNSLVCRPYTFHGNFLPEGRKGRPVVLGSCNGLVALYKCPGNFLLFNPCTKEEKRVRGQSDIGRYSIWRSLWLYGLFHDPTRDEYKVLMGSSTSFYVVSLRDGSFKRSVGMEKVYLGSVSSPTETTVRGIPDWACLPQLHGEVVIVYYNQLKDQELQVVQFPKARANLWNRVGLCPQLGMGALEGQLSVALQVDETLGIEVWALKGYQNDPSDWSMLFVIANVSGPITILSWVTDDEILIAGQCLMLYNIRNRSSRDLLRLDKNSKTVTYIPSWTKIEK